MVGCVTFQSNASNLPPNCAGVSPRWVYTGPVLRKYEYRRYQEGTSPNWTPLRFPGQYHDAETDLHENWHRYYDPVTGRYLQPEPMHADSKWVLAQIAAAAIMPTYAYANNNPVHFIDRRGKDIQLLDLAGALAFASMIQNGKGLKWIGYLRSSPNLFRIFGSAAPSATIDAAVGKGQALGATGNARDESGRAIESGWEGPDKWRSVLAAQPLWRSRAWMVRRLTMSIGSLILLAGLAWPGNNVAADQLAMLGFRRVPAQHGGAESRGLNFVRRLQVDSGPDVLFTAIGRTAVEFLMISALGDGRNVAFDSLLLLVDCAPKENTGLRRCKLKEFPGYTVVDSVVCGRSIMFFLPTAEAVKLARTACALEPANSQ